MITLVAAAVDAIPGADAGGITEVRRRGREKQVQFATDPLVTERDTAQYELGQGPCLDAAYEHRTVRVSDFTTDERWPAFAPPGPAPPAWAACSRSSCTSTATTSGR